MSNNNRTEDIYEKALLGINLPILPLDNKWYRLMVGLEKTKEMEEKEENIKALLKKQGKLNTDIKRLKKMKQQLMDEIVGAMEAENSEEIKETKRNKIEECNSLIDEYQDELLDIPDKIKNDNYYLMLHTMEQCYELIQDNTRDIMAIAEWINSIRIELKKNVVKKQDMELKNQEIYNYMHDIFGADVIDIFDMKYNPGEKQLKKKKE